jgi:hypothetical protein
LRVVRMLADDRMETAVMSFKNLSKRRLWSEDECRIMINAALIKLIEDAGGVITISTEDLFKAADNGNGTLALSLSDDDKILTLTRLKPDGITDGAEGIKNVH